jgi:hypothetical protein
MKARRLIQYQGSNKRNPITKPVTVPEQTQTTITKPVTVPETVNTITKPQVSAPVTPVVSALVEAPHGITVVDATLDELKEAMRKKIWTPSYDTFFESIS